jgi:hypothetical protein
MSVSTEEAESNLELEDEFDEYLIQDRAEESEEPQSEGEG